MICNGDLNCEKLNPLHNNKRGECLLDICDIHDLDSLIIITNPTRISKKTVSCQDVILTKYRVVFYLFCLYKACFTHLISSNLSCNSCLWYYDQLVHFDKEINANVYRPNLWEYYKRFHCSLEWHLTPHMTLYIETYIRRAPCIKRTLKHSPRVSA